MEFKKVILQTNDLSSMKTFYTEQLELQVTEESEDHFQVLAGTSLLEFTSRGVISDPFYHFAFDIPSNKFSEAKTWTAPRVKLNTEDGMDEVFFPNISAHSFYFYDPAGNVVELISRHSASEQREGPFSSSSILRISEMSLTVESAGKAAQLLFDIGLKERDDDPISDTSLNFIGKSANGPFLLLTQPGRRWFFSNKTSAIHPLEIVLDTNDRIVITEDCKIEVTPAIS